MKPLRWVDGDMWRTSNTMGGHVNMWSGALWFRRQHVDRGLYWTCGQQWLHPVCRHVCDTSRLSKRESSACHIYMVPIWCGSIPLFQRARFWVYMQVSTISMSCPVSYHVITYTCHVMECHVMSCHVMSPCVVFPIAQGLGVLVIMIFFRKLVCHVMWYVMF